LEGGGFRCLKIWGGGGGVLKKIVKIFMWK